MSTMLMVVATVGCPTAGKKPKQIPPAPEEASDAPTVSEALEEAGREFRGGNQQAAGAGIQNVLTVDPDNLEAWVLKAMIAEARKEEGKATGAWARVERILVVNGKLQAFLMQQTLFAAARQYLKLDVQARSDLFAEELLRRHPTSDWSAKMHLLKAEQAARKRRWSEVEKACDHLVRVLPRHTLRAKCEKLAARASRLRRLGPAPESTNAAAWQWEWPLPQGNGLRSVWVGTNAEVIVVGVGGTILHSRRGRRFAPMDSGTRWTLNAIVGTSRNNLFAVGDGGVILRFDGKRWTVVRPGDAERVELWGAYSAGPGSLVAVGDDGWVVTLSKDAKLQEERATNLTLRDVWAADDGKLLAVGDQGTLLRRSQGQWAAVRSDSYEDLWAIDGHGGDAVIVGSKRTVVRVAGASAKEDVIGMTDFRGLWMNKGRAWAVGVGGGIVAKSGSRWKTQRSGTLLTLYDVAGSRSNLWAVGDGGTILVCRGCRGGGRWSRLAGGMRQQLVGVSMSASPPVALGAEGALLVRRRGRWQQQALPVGKRFAALWGEGARMAAAGARGLLVVRDGAAYRRVATGVAENLRGIWGWGDNVVAVGSRGTLLRVTGQSTVHRDTSPVGLDLNAVWGNPYGNGAANIVAVGNRGAILRFDGRQWRVEQTPTLANLHAVFGSTGREVVVGEGGIVLRRSNGRWRAEQAPVSQALVGVWGDNAGIYAVSRHGTVVHHDGRRWRVQRSPATCLSAISGHHSAGIVAVGCHGAVISRVSKEAMTGGKK